MNFWLLSIGLLLLISCENKDNGTEKSTVDNNQLKTKEMDIQFAYTILYVKNVPETMDFYQNTFGFEEKMLTPEKDYGEIDSGITTLAFANLELGKANFKKGFIESELANKPFGFELAFTTPNVEKTMEIAIANGAILLVEAVTKPWGQKVGYLRDFNGFIIEICTPIQNQD